MIVCAVLLSFGVSAPHTARAAQPPAVPVVSPATELQFQNDIMATKANDQRLYIIIGSGFFRPTTAGDARAFVSKWLSQHSSATAIPISRMLTTNTRTKKQEEIVYVWIEQGKSSLSIDLVRAGYFVAASMYDMVDNERGLAELLKDPKLADARADLEKERAAAPQDRTDRLVSEADYSGRMQRINDAEQRARAEKLGVWSDAMKDEREAEGVR